MQYFIRKIWSATNVPYKGPMCDLCKIEPGKIYESEELAQVDCAKMNYSSKFFEIAQFIQEEEDAR